MTVTPLTSFIVSVTAALVSLGGMLASRSYYKRAEALRWRARQDWEAIDAARAKSHRDL